MKLSSFQQQVLQFIRDEYPIPYDPSSVNQVIAIGERPLATNDSIREHFAHESAESIDAALVALVGYQLVAKVYLYDSDEFVEQRTAGTPVRQVILKSPSGQDAYQITTFGDDTLSGFEVRDYPKQVENWFRGKWWSVPVRIVFVGLPAIVGYITMLKMVLGWFGVLPNE